MISPSLTRLAVGAAAFATAVIATPDTASADVVVHGSVRVDAGATYVAPPPRRIVRRRRFRRTYRPIRARRFVARGSLWAGDLYIGWAPPPPPPRCEVRCGPPVHAIRPAPVVVRPPSQTVVARPAPPPAPRFALGAFAGGIDVQDREAGEAVGLVGRFQVGRHLGLEAELSREQIENDVRIDYRAGGALVLGLIPDGRLNPYLLAGGGVMFTDVADGAYTSKDPYAEAGVGLELKLSRHLSLQLEGRAGARRATGGDPGEVPLKSIAPPADDEETYSRGRLGALIYF